MQRNEMPPRLTPLHLPFREWQPMALPPESQLPNKVSPGKTSEERAATALRVAQRVSIDAMKSTPSSLSSLLAELTAYEKAAHPSGSPKRADQSPLAAPVMSGEPHGSAGSVASRGRQRGTRFDTAQDLQAEGALPFSPTFARSLNRALRQAKRTAASNKTRVRATPAPTHRARTDHASAWGSPRVGSSDGPSAWSSPVVVGSPASVRSGGDCMFPMDLDGSTQTSPQLGVGAQWPLAERSPTHRF